MYDADNIIIGVKVGDDVKEAYVLVTSREDADYSPKIIFLFWNIVLKKFRLVFDMGLFFVLWPKYTYLYLRKNNPRGNDYGKWRIHPAIYDAGFRPI